MVQLLLLGSVSVWIQAALKIEGENNIAMLGKINQLKQAPSMTNCMIVWNVDVCCFVGVGASNAQECSRLESGPHENPHDIKVTHDII